MKSIEFAKLGEPNEQFPVLEAWKFFVESTNFVQKFSSDNTCRGVYEIVEKDFSCCVFGVGYFFRKDF
ncbi:hypothetical protein D3C84_1115050 [compost metagenome]